VLHRLVLFSILIPLPVCAAADTTEITGHVKAGVLGQAYAADSVFHDLLGASSTDSQVDLRLNVEHRRSGWTIAANYQLTALNGERYSLPDDGRRLFDLTSVIEQGGESALLHRLDRLWLGYASEKAVVRFGRQVLSWGNGLFYTPMDLVNPFDPAAVDTEYKVGDDMLYLQYLRDNGADIQGAWVIRRNLADQTIDSDAATSAVKYHGFAGAGEYDLMVARHYGDDVLGLGASRSVGGAQWGGDLVITKTDSDTYAQLSTNISYSWTWAGKNMSGVLEYHYNGFGQHPGEYNPVAVATNPDLSRRLLRGESFTLGRNYLGASVMIEMTPLWTMSPTVLVNADDPSGLLQLVTRYSLSDSMTLLASLNVPLGANGSEFGGIDSGLPGRYLSTDAGVFAQLAWYF
jgi:hypothetical protein